MSYKERICSRQDNVCITVGSITNEFPIFAEIKPENGVAVRGEIRRLVQ